MDERNDLQEIIDATLADMAREAGGHLDPEDVNLAEFSRRTGLSRSKARTLKAKGFRVTPHGRTGMRADRTVMSDVSDAADALLRQGVTNSQVVFDNLRELGYAGGLTSVKDYIKAHRHLVPAARALAAGSPNRGRRYETGPGECYQMDWGFVNAEGAGAAGRLACFAMVCHHCGHPYLEFFPSARQESLFCGVIRAFLALGIPDRVLTDNMKSVVTGRDAQGHPIWNAEYAAFMEALGFRTSLCKPRHPYTKGKVERLIRYVKGNFLAGRSFAGLDDLNAQALEWCAWVAAKASGATGVCAAEEHAQRCMAHARTLELDGEVALYLCPERSIGFDGFVSYEGRRFGVPYSYEGRTCRVCREGGLVRIWSSDLSRELCSHPVTWSRADSPCEGQWADDQPEELPSAPVAATLRMSAGAGAPTGFERFDFERGLR